MNTSITHKAGRLLGATVAAGALSAGIFAAAPAMADGVNTVNVNSVNVNTAEAAPLDTYRWYRETGFSYQTKRLCERLVPVRSQNFYSGASWRCVKATFVWYGEFYIK